MKTLICSVLLLGLVNLSLADLKSDEGAIEKACIAETKTSDKEANDFWEPNVNYDKTTPNMKCQLKCVMEKLGHLKGGVFNAEKAAKDWNEIAETDPSAVLSPKAFSACKNEKGANDCETAFKIIKCMRLFKA